MFEMVTTMKIRRMNNNVLEICDEDSKVILSIAEEIVDGKLKITLSGEIKSLLSIQQMIDEIENSSMVLIHVSKEVMSIFKESGFSEILMIEND